MDHSPEHKTELIDEDEDIDINIKEEDDTDIINHFESLSTESMSNICSFLDHSSIKQMKKVSRQCGIVCLEEQTKTSVQSFNANQLMDNDDMNIFDFKMNKFTTSRHNANKRVYSFLEEWSHHYNIPEKHQLIATFARSFPRKPLICNLTKNRLETMHYITNRRFLILDKRKVIILNKKHARQFNDSTDTVEALKEYRLVILEYFDVLQQQCDVVQFLLLHIDCSYVNLFEYIEHKFIYVDDIDHKWHKELLLVLKQMNYDANCPKLCVYEHYRTQKSISVADISKSLLYNRFWGLTVQLNPKHDWFNTSTDKLIAIKRVCSERMDRFHVCSKEFCVNVINAQVRYQGNQTLLMDSVEKYYESAFNKEEYYGTLRSIQGFNGEFRKIKTSRTSWSGSARIKIAELFQNIIKPNNIELFGASNRMRKGWNEILGYDHDTIRFDIVLYDTKNFVMDESDVLYRVNIYGLNEAPTPFRLKSFQSDVRSFTFKYKRKFKVKQLVKYIFGSMESAKGHLLRYQYDELLDVYFKDREKLVRNKNITFVLEEEKNQENVTGYTMNENKYISLAVGDNKCWITILNLFMIESHHDDRKYKLKIKFSSNKNHKFSSNIRIEQLNNVPWVGMPMIVWIDKEDTLQQVMDKYLDENTRKWIQCTYRVVVGKKIVSIAKGKRSTYKPYYQFLKNNDKDYIVLSLMKSKATGALLPIYSANVHKAVHD